VDGENEIADACPWTSPKLRADARQLTIEPASRIEQTKQRSRAGMAPLA
jgi:hypothetical protein